MDAEQDIPHALLKRGLTAATDCAWLAQLKEGEELRAQSALLEDFNAHELGIFGAAMRHLKAQPGQVLIAEGDTGDWMLIVLSGTVDVSKRVMRHDALGNLTSQELEIARLAVLRSGAVIGEMSMFDGEPRNASCIALDEVQVGLLTRQAIARLINTQPAVGAKLLVKITQLLAQRLRNASSKVVKTVALAKQGQKQDFDDSVVDMVVE
jgi:CRP/FNR family transcriptional regulator, cyclic AMP receptor protein